MQYQAINCRHYLPSAQKDSGTGRCRATVRTAQSFVKSQPLSAGSIITVALFFPGICEKVDGQIDSGVSGAQAFTDQSPVSRNCIASGGHSVQILCTLWPVSEGNEFALQDGYLLLDTSFMVSPSCHDVAALNALWRQCECEVRFRYAFVAAD